MKGTVYLFKIYFCFSISFCMCKRASFLYIVFLSTIFFRGIYNHLLKLFNKYFFVYNFNILLFFHLVFQFFYLCNGIMCLCRSIIYFLPGLDCRWLLLPTSPSSLATSPKASFAFFF